jgi:LuxR family quorum-sensing system transcriptional regulator SolR
LNSWQEDLTLSTANEASAQAVFDRIATCARELGFEYCAYGLRTPLPLSNPATTMHNNYPQIWQRRYAQARYLGTDPAVLHGRRTQAPLVWTDSVFSTSPQFWNEACESGLRVGWSQSILDANGIGGMLSLSRSGELLTVAELQASELKMRWLVHVAHCALSRLHRAHAHPGRRVSLTEREVEILKWTGDGKTSSEISDILAVSENTVNFHVKNAVRKLDSANKTSAVVRAAMMGLLS